MIQTSTSVRMSVGTAMLEHKDADEIHKEAEN